MLVKRQNLRALIWHQFLSAFEQEATFQEVNADRDMSFKSFYFFTLIGMAILYGTMWVSAMSRISKPINPRMVSAFLDTKETDIGFKCEFSGKFYDCVSRNLSYLSRLSFCLSSRLRRTLAVVTACRIRIIVCDFARDIDWESDTKNEFGAKGRNFGLRDDGNELFAGWWARNKSSIGLICMCHCWGKWISSIWSVKACINCTTIQIWLAFIPIFYGWLALSSYLPSGMLGSKEGALWRFIKRFGLCLKQISRTYWLGYWSLLLSHSFMHKASMSKTPLCKRQNCFDQWGGVACRMVSEPI